MNKYAIMTIVATVHITLTCFFLFDNVVDGAELEQREQHPEAFSLQEKISGHTLLALMSPTLPITGVVFNKELNNITLLSCLILFNSALCSFVVVSLWIKIADKLDERQFRKLRKAKEAQLMNL